MNARLPTLVSVLLHLGLLIMLSFVTFQTRKFVTPPAGMAIEILDLDHAMPLPDPAFARQESVDTAPQAAAMEQVERQTDPASLAQETIPPQPIVPPAPAPDVSQHLPETPQSSATTAPALGPGPVKRPLPAAPTPFVPPASAPISPSPGTASSSTNAPAPAARRLDAAALARKLGKPEGTVSRPRLNSGAIGTAIGQAVPRGVAGLTVRQRTNLADMIRSQITPCWNPPPPEGASGHVTILMRIRLGQDGQVDGVPAVTRINGQTPANGAYANALAGSVRRAVLRCAPLRLPAELYDAWADVELNFDPRDIS